MKAIDRSFFFEMLHEARDLKQFDFPKNDRAIFLTGMKKTFINHREDLEIADNTRDVWKHLNSGAER